MNSKNINEFQKTKLNFIPWILYICTLILVVMIQMQSIMNIDTNLADILLLETLPMFGGGIRMCPGRKLAIIELKSFMALVYRKYDIELAEKDAPLKYRSETINVCDELKIKVKPRKF